MKCRPKKQAIEAELEEAQKALARKTQEVSQLKQYRPQDQDNKDWDAYRPARDPNETSVFKTYKQPDIQVLESRSRRPEPGNRYDWYENPEQRGNPVRQATIQQEDPMLVAARDPTVQRLVSVLNRQSGRTNLTLKDHNITHFSEKAGHDITSFFSQFDRATNSIGLTELQKIQLLPGYLGEVGRKFYEAKYKANPNWSYGEWKTELTTRFRPEDFLARKREELANKTLTPGQNTEEFFDQILELMQDVDPLMPEEAKIADIRRAIRAVPGFFKQLAPTPF